MDTTGLAYILSIEISQLHYIVRIWKLYKGIFNINNMVKFMFTCSHNTIFENFFTWSSVFGFSITIFIFQGSEQRESATYIWPCEKTGCSKEIPNFLIVCPLRFVNSHCECYMNRELSEFQFNRHLRIIMYKGNPRNKYRITCLWAGQNMCVDTWRR